jgi:hypothetical protein
MTITATPALEAAGAIMLPVRLPPGPDGEPLRCLSVSSVTRFMQCSDDWRRWYLRRERAAPTGAMFLGARVDDALTLYSQTLIDTSEQLTLAELRDAYRKRWPTARDAEEEEHGPIRWESELGERATFALGLQALEVAHRDLLPAAGRPLACQRQLRFRLHEALEWEVLGYADVDTVREQRVFRDENGEALGVAEPGQGEPTVSLSYLRCPAEHRPPVKRGRRTLDPEDAIHAHQRDVADYAERHRAWLDAGDPEAPEPRMPAELPKVEVPVSALAAQVEEREVHGITDFKVKRSAISQLAADGDLQASVYLAEAMFVAERPVEDFTFLAITKPKPGSSGAPGSAIVRTRRAEHQLLAALTLIGQVAAQISALFAAFGADRPWGYAPPDSWRCRPDEGGTRGRFCAHWHRCPMGGGLRNRPVLCSASTA